MVITERKYVWAGPFGNVEMLIGEEGGVEFVGMPVTLVQAGMTSFPKAVAWCETNKEALVTDRPDQEKVTVVWVPSSEVMGDQPSSDV